MTREREDYALPNAWEQTDRRLGLFEACHDPASTRRAAELGVGPGWRCLEAGAGRGSFARWLARRVGPDGAVVAADLDVRLLEDLDEPGLEVRQVDLVTGELERDAYDFVHTRCVLLHLPARDEILARLVAALRPGGILMVEEDDSLPILPLATGAYHDAWKAFMATMGEAGTDPEWARDLPGRLAALGLTDVGAAVDGQLFAGGSPPARFWATTWLQARERLVAQGVDAGVLDRGREALEDPRRWFRGSDTIVAWGTRPARRFGRAPVSERRLR